LRGGMAVLGQALDEAQVEAGESAGPQHAMAGLGHWASIKDRASDRT
jgi:hypothetical protein